MKGEVPTLFPAPGFRCFIGYIDGETFHHYEIPVVGWNPYQYQDDGENCIVFRLMVFGDDECVELISSTTPSNGASQVVPPGKDLDLEKLESAAREKVKAQTR